MRVTVLMGGANTERDVSISSGTQVADALRKAGHEVAAVDTATAVDDPDGIFTDEPTGETPTVRLDPPAAEEIRELRAARTGQVFASGVLQACAAGDLVVIMVYGDEGESGHAQAVLDWVDLPYAGPGPTPCAVSFDKDLTKRLARDAGLPTADWRIVARSDAEEVLEDLDLAGPWVVKPVRGGSTVGTSFADEPASLNAAVHAAHEHDLDAIVETYQPGTEVSVSLLGDRALPVVEIRTETATFDYKSKYQAGHAEEICPAPIPDDERDEVQRLALAMSRALKMPPDAFPRVDLRQGEDGTYRILEVNSLPGMTATSLYPQCAAAAGMDLPTVCDAIVRRSAAHLGL